MSVQDKAAAVIRANYGAPTVDIVQTLADAGLLAQDPGYHVVPSTDTMDGRSFREPTVKPDRETVSAEDVEAMLVKEWHEDQCACRDFDGVDIETCYTRKEAKYPGSMVPPMTFVVNDVLRVLALIQGGE